MPQMMFRPPPMRPGLQALGMRMPQGELQNNYFSLEHHCDQKRKTTTLLITNILLC